MLELPGSEATSWVGELERPQEIARLLEIGSYSENLVNQVLHTDDPEFSKVFLHDSIISQGDTLLLDLAITTLIYEFTNRLEVGIPVGDPWFDDLQHFGCCLCETNEDAVVDLE